jgi:TonB family protein
MLAATFGALVGLPLVSAGARPVWIALRMAQARSLPAPANRSRTADSRIHITPSRPVAPTPLWTAADLLTAGWIAGMLALLLPVGVGLRQVRRLRRSGRVWPEARALANVPVLLHDELTGPMTCGVVRPAILLPSDAPNWDAEDLNRAIEHEMAHVRRRDWFSHCAARAVCAVYWFHPLVWILRRRLELEAERACDDAVLARSDASAYADQLVGVARRLSAGSRPPLLAMATRADLGLRVRAVLDSKQRRGRAGRRCVAVLAGAAAALVFAISPLRVSAVPQDTGPSGGVRLRTSTNLVTVGVKVSFPNGNAVEGLTSSDFMVSEDGVPQTILFFETMPDGYGYILGYYTRNMREDGQFRKIEITVKSPTTATLEYRPGYYANKRFADSAASGAPSAPPDYTTPPVLIYKKEADYSDEARKAKYQGTVLLMTNIDSSGKVTDVRVVRSLGLGLDEKAIEAVKQWQFKPATKDGQPVSAPTTVEVLFRLM